MAQTVRQPIQSDLPPRSRRDDLARPPELRREFPVREAQRQLQAKERRWAPVAYGVFLLALIFIFCSAYTTFAFSKYRGVILPGVYVDNVSLGGLTEKHAINAIYAQLNTIYYRPVSVKYGPRGPWEPKNSDIGVQYQISKTVKAAQAVGRAGGFFRELIDRLPFHPMHTVPLVYTVDHTQLRAYLRHIGSSIYKQGSNATLKTRDSHVMLVASERGLQVDIPKSEMAVEAALGRLTRQTVTLQVDHIEPVITDRAAITFRDRIERFLSSPPVIRVGKLRIVTSRSDFAPMLNFQNVVTKNKATIQMTVADGQLHGYVSKLAGAVDRPAENPKVDFTAGRSQLISPRKTGRILDQGAAYTQLAAVVQGLKPKARLYFRVAVTQPPVDPANPASLGINTLLGSGVTSFDGAGSGRLSDITQIAKTLDGDLVSPRQEVSFNTLAGTSWDARVYQDDESQASDGAIVPGSGGAMQQTATTFLRAFYQAGLKISERHAHSHRLSWYEPPVGLDAIVSPVRGWDLRFTNNTGKYLLIKTRVEPVRKELYFYVYGPKLGWSVAIDKVGKITATVPHGPKIVREDPTLAAGDTRQTQWPHDGATTVVRRTITYRNGRVSTDEIHTTYRPWQAIVLKGPALNVTPTPTPGKADKRGTPGPTPTPTFNH